MNRLKNFAVGASIAALAAVGGGVGAASAHTTVLKVLCTSGCAGSPFSFGPFGPGSIGTLEGVLNAKSGETYDWTFNITAPNALMEMQAATGSPFTPQPIQFTLWSGTPGGSHALVDTSADVIGATLTETLATGDYFLQLAPSGVAVVGEQVDGSLSVSGAPEPASWLMMIGGLAMIGAGLRMRERISPIFG